MPKTAARQPVMPSRPPGFRTVRFGNQRHGGCGPHRRTVREWTPYGPGQPWPERVDTFLAEGIEPGSVDRWVQSAAVLHSNGDGLDIAVKDGRIVGVRGRAVDRVNHGRLDPKDMFGWQANASKDRLTTPMIRVGGRLRPCDWDTAMDAIVTRSRQLLDSRGAGSIGFYTSGQLFLEEYYTQGIIAAAPSAPTISTGTPACAQRQRPRPSRNRSAATDSRAPTPTSITPTSSRCSATTSPRRRRCCGPGCWTGSPAATLRRSVRRPAAHTRGPARHRAPGTAAGHQRRPDERIAARADRP